MTKLTPNVPLYKRVKVNGKWTMRAIGFYSPNRDFIYLKDKSVWLRASREEISGYVNKPRESVGEEE